MANRILECADRYVERIKKQSEKGVDLGGKPIEASLVRLEQSMDLTYEYEKRRVESTR